VCGLGLERTPRLDELVLPPARLLEQGEVTRLLLVQLTLLPLPLCALLCCAAPPRLLARPLVRARRALQLCDRGPAAFDLCQRGHHLGQQQLHPLAQQLVLLAQLLGRRRRLPLQRKCCAAHASTSTQWARPREVRARGPGVCHATRGAGCFLPLNPRLEITLGLRFAPRGRGCAHLGRGRCRSGLGGHDVVAQVRNLPLQILERLLHNVAVTVEATALAALSSHLALKLPELILLERQHRTSLS